MQFHNLQQGEEHVHIEDSVLPSSGDETPQKGRDAWRQVVLIHYLFALMVVP